MNRLGHGSRNTSIIGFIIFALLFVAAFVFLSYLFVIMVTLGAIIFLIAYIRMRFFKKPLFSSNVFIRTTVIEYTDRRKGRVIEQDEEK